MLETRAARQAGGDCSRCPLSAMQRPPAVLEGDVEPLATGHPPLIRSRRLTATGTRQHLADGTARLESLSAAVAGHRLAWTERRLGVRARQLGRAGETALRGRLAKARAAVAARQEAVAALLTRYRGQGLLAVRDTAQVREYPLRRSGNRPATVQVERALGVKAVVDRPAVVTAVSRLGWRVYATNAPPEQLSLVQAVRAYRSPSLVESDIGRLNGHPWSLPAMFLERDDHATGLIRRLSVGLWALTLLACVVRQRLTAARTVLAGLYAGHPKRATARPTTERLRKCVEGLTLTIIREGRRRRYPPTPLSAGQRRMLRLLNFLVDIYARLCLDSHKPP